jgi:hypothetical protein
MMGDNVLDDVLRAYCAAKIQRQHILNQNGANMVNNHALDIAQKLGLNTDEANKRLGITPFPSPQTSTSINNTQASSPWLSAALVALSAIGGAGAMAATSAYMTKTKTADTPPAVVEPYKSSLGEVDIDVS